MHSHRRPETHHSLRCSGAALLVAGLLLTGCAGNVPSNFGLPSSGSSAASLRISGVVHGGQNPVSGATLQLYTVGTTPSGSPATYTSQPLFTRSITTGSDGGFSFSPSDYNNCSTATDVYLVATGGNPGGGVNAQLSMVAALGPCTNLTAATNIVVNEVTTIAAAYALAPFATGYGNIGANFGSSTNVVPNGLAAAFANAALLSDTTVGTAGSSGLATGVTVPISEINSLADILASCVNSTGTGSQSCTPLFAATSATDTFGAALGIAKNPGAPAVTALYDLYNGVVPFQPTLVLSSPPQDFTVALSIANGLATPYGLAIDASGNAWVTNAAGSSVSEFSPAGVLLGTRSAVGAKALALDNSNNLWVAATTANSVLEYGPTGSLLHTFTGTDISAPTAIALTGTGTAWIANLNGNNVTAINSAGNRLANAPFNGAASITQPSGVAIDSAANVYVTSGSGSIVQLNSSGQFQASLTDGTLQGPVSVAVDPVKGTILAPGYTTGTSIRAAVGEYTSNAVALAVSPVDVGSSVGIQGGIASDGTSIWLGNSSGGLVQVSLSSSQIVSNPYYGYGLNGPAGVAVDASGSVWTANSVSSTVSKYIGLAQPVTTPIAVHAGSPPS